MAAANIPSVQVWLGEETAGIDGAVTWVDISAYVSLAAGITRTVGQSYGGGAQPGSCSLTLENTDGRFTVGNTGSPYYPYVHLQSLVKIQRDGRPFFIGRIQAAPMQWPTGGDAIATVTWTLADKMARYERMMLKSYPVEEIKALSPVAYFPMTEASGATEADNQTLNLWGPLKVVKPGDGTIAFAGATGPAGDGSSSPQFTPGTVPATLISAGGAFDNTALANGWTFTSAFATTLGGLLARFVMSVNSDGITWGGGGSPGNWVTVDVSAESYLGNPGVMVRAYTPALILNAWHFPKAVLDGATHTVAAIDPGTATAPIAYIDGAVVTATVVASGSWRSRHALSATLQVGSAASNTVWTPTGFTGTISHLALWTRFLTSGEVAGIDAALRGTTLTTNAAFLKVLGWRGQAATALIDAGVADNIPSTVLGNGSLASVLSALNSSEAGTLYVNGSDQLVWRNRRVLPTPAISIPTDDVDPGTTFNNDLTRVQTLVTCNIQGGGSVTAVATDYTTVGEITGSVTSLTTLTGDALAHASWTANTGPRGPYIGSLKIDQATVSAATNTAVDTGGILTQVTLTGMPSQTPPGATVLEVVGETETVSSTAWDLTWMVLPAGLGSARDVLVLNDATFGVIGSTHVLAY